MPILRHTQSRTSDLILLTALVLTLSCVCPSDCTARVVYFTADGGLSIPSGDEFFAEPHSTAFGGGIGVVLDAGSRLFFTGDIEYWLFPFDDSFTAFRDGDVQIVMFGATSRFQFFAEDDNYQPYIMAGYGTVDISLRDKEPNTFTIYDTDQLQPYFHIGFGVELYLTDTFKGVIEARYVNIAWKASDAATSFFPITVGVRF